MKIHTLLMLLSVCVAGCPDDSSPGATPTLDAADVDAAGDAEAPSDEGPAPDDSAKPEDSAAPPDTCGTPDVPPPEDAAEPDAHEEDVADEDTSGPMCVPPAMACDTADSCCEGSWCVGNKCPASTGAGLCTDPAKDTCGCGAEWDDCTTPGTYCLSAGCDYPGLCVTPEEGAAVCGSDDTGCFECPTCGGQVLPKLVGVWKLASVTAVVDGATVTLAPDSDYILGFDQSLSTLTIAADGQFQGPLMTDYTDIWHGCLATIGHGQDFALSVQTCDVECYGYDALVGKLGKLSMDGDQIVVRRVGVIHNQEFVITFDVPLQLRYSL